MFNYAAIDKTPTVNQVKAIIKYMEEDPNVGYDFSYMMGMQRHEPNTIYLDLNNAHIGRAFKVVFNDQNEITSFESTGTWMS
jgi:hypothetical protein